MSCDRFLLLLRFLHFNDNDLYDANDPNRDRLCKIRPVVDLLKATCPAVYRPGRDLCVDESLVLFKGRLAFKQFIHTKRARFGIKFYELCTSSGVLLDLMVYHGKMREELPDVTDMNFLFSEKIPLALMYRYLDKGHRLFVDNYNSSTRLAQYLLNRDTKLVGTVRLTRHNFPHDSAHADVGHAETKFAATNSGILAIKYCAKNDRANNKPKIVCLLTTDHTNKVASSAKKRQRRGEPIVKPTCVLDYNRCTGGVDLMDQQLDSLLVIRKSYKWYKKLFFVSCSRWRWVRIRCVSAVVVVQISLNFYMAVWPNWPPSTKLSSLDNPVLNQTSVMHLDRQLSLNRLMLGRKTRGPLDIVVGVPPGEEEGLKNIDQFVAERQRIMRMRDSGTGTCQRKSRWGTGSCSTSSHRRMPRPCCSTRRPQHLHDFV